MADEPHRWIKRAARFGHVATGLVYLLVGGIAFTAAFDSRITAVEAQGALASLLVGNTFGAALLFAIAAGLTADFAWQIVRASTNADLAPSNVLGLANRAGWVISGGVHFGLAISAVKLALAVPQQTAEHQAKASAAAVMLVPVGRLALTAAGIVIVLVGLQLVYRAWIGDVDRWLDLRSLSFATRAVILWLGRFGLAMRAIVFCAGGLVLTAAALENRPWATRGLQGTLSLLQFTTVGPVLLAVVAAGFIAFGIVELVSARYRRIRVPTAEAPSALPKN
jgi:energy-converting hydrogenase Eha subunit A